jgi:hypothetical protein
VIVVAPVLNLSGSEDFDPLKISDLIASELATFPDTAVVPVNLALAELDRQGKRWVETPDDAVRLGRVFGADATVVTAITEYRPDAPPVVGMVMQWYPTRPAQPSGRALDPVAASRSSRTPDVSLSADATPAPMLQVQRVFNASHDAVANELKDYARTRDASDSPYGWQRYTKSQELYVRYCGWALIRTMVSLSGGIRAAGASNEAGP